MSQSDKIFVIPTGPSFYEGQNTRIPDEGVFVSPSSYYFRLVKDGSLIIGDSSIQSSKKKTSKE